MKHYCIRAINKILSYLYGDLPDGGSVKFVEIRNADNAPGYWEARRKDGRWLTCGSSVFDCRRRAIDRLKD